MLAGSRQQIRVAVFAVQLLSTLTLAVLPCGCDSDSDSLWRPRLHFFFRDPETGVGFHTNDATGSFYDEAAATWHAFYDCTPPPSYYAGAAAAAAGKKPGSSSNSSSAYSWCEASSSDLVHWTQAARAVLPQDSGCDAANLETGAITLSPLTGELLAIFSAKGNESHPPGSPEWEHVCAARGKVLGSNGGGGGGESGKPDDWSFKVLDSVVIENPNHGNGFRDPSRAIKLADGNYYLVVGTDAGYTPVVVAGAGVGAVKAPPQLAQASLWVNTDGSLLRWAPAGVLLADNAAIFPECPDLFPLSPLPVEQDEPGAGKVPPQLQQMYVLLASETYRRGTRWYQGTLRRQNSSATATATTNSTTAAAAPAGYQLDLLASGPLDYNYGSKKGMSYYAPRTMAPIRSASGLGGRRVLLGWIRADPSGRAHCSSGGGGSGCVPYPAHGVNWTFGDFTAFPRELWLAADNTFAQRFVPELSKNLRRPPTPAAATVSSSGGRTTDSRRLEIAMGSGSGAVKRAHSMLEVQGRELELSLTVTAAGEGCDGATARWSATVSFLRSVAGEEETVLSIEVVPVPAAGAGGGGDASSNWTLVLDRSRSAWNSSWPDATSISAPLRERSSNNNTGIRSRSSSLHAFVDRSIVEVIANNATAITARVFPQRDNSTAVMVAVEGGVGASAAAKNCTVTADFSAWSLAL
eukprot:gene2094-11946_t